MLNWKRPSKCDNSGPNCPEIAIDEPTGTVYVRSSKRPEDVAVLDADEWATLKDGVTAGEF